MYIDHNRATPHLPPMRPSGVSSVPAARFPTPAAPPLPAECPLRPGAARPNPWAYYPDVDDGGRPPPYAHPGVEDEYADGPQLLALRLGTFGLSGAAGAERDYDGGRFLRSSPHDLPHSIQWLLDVQAMGESELVGRGGRLDLMV